MTKVMPETNTKSPTAAAAKPAAAPAQKLAENGNARLGSATDQHETGATSHAPGAEPVSPFPKSWDEIRVGSFVLAPASESGWFDAVVTAITNDLLTLRWRDYPRDPITRRRHEVGLLVRNQQ